MIHAVGFWIRDDLQAISLRSNDVLKSVFLNVDENALPKLVQSESDFTFHSNRSLCGPSSLYHVKTRNNSTGPTAQHTASRPIANTSRKYIYMIDHKALCLQDLIGVKNNWKHLFLYGCRLHGLPETLRVQFNSETKKRILRNRQIPYISSHS